MSCSIPSPLFEGMNLDDLFEGVNMDELFESARETLEAFLGNRLRPFCCEYIIPVRLRRLQHEMKFRSLGDWNNCPRAKNSTSDPESANHLQSALQASSHAFSIIRRVDKKATARAELVVDKVTEGPKYWLATDDTALANEGRYVEVKEEDLISAGYSRSKTYKNFRCHAHGTYFEVDLYVKDGRELGDPVSLGEATVSTEQ